MKITVFGAGYVGLVTAACLASQDYNQVMCCDTDEKKILGIGQGIMPFFEPGLQELVARGLESGKLLLTTDSKEAVQFSPINFIAVGTPSKEDGSADLAAVMAVAASIGQHLKGTHPIVIVKSTVPVFTTAGVRSAIQEQLDDRMYDAKFSVVSNPEFLCEGRALKDFMEPGRIVVGVDDAHCLSTLAELYGPFTKNGAELMFMDTRSAELSKYAANAMLATRISFMNEMAGLAEKVGANIEQVRRVVGSDPRIGPSFLRAGAGYGGSCFPKDVRALAHMGASHGHEMHLTKAVERVNDCQVETVASKVLGRFSHFDRISMELEGFTFAVWGLAFKSGTTDLRESPSLRLIDTLLKHGAAVRCHDSFASDMNIPAELLAHGRFTIHDTLVDTVPNERSGLVVSGVIVMTEDPLYVTPGALSIARRMIENRVIFDGRNVFDLDCVPDFEYFSIGRRPKFPGGKSVELVEVTRAQATSHAPNFQLKLKDPAVFDVRVKVNQPTRSIDFTIGKAPSFKPSDSTETGEGAITQVPAVTWVDLTGVKLPSGPWSPTPETGIAVLVEENGDEVIGSYRPT